MPRFHPTLLTSGLALTCLCASALEPEIPRAIPVDAPVGDTVTSNSGQFRVRGGEPALRGSVALLAEQTRAEFLRLTEEPRAGFRIPVHIQLLGQSGDQAQHHPITKAITYHDGGYEMRITVHVARGLDGEAFQSAITAALVYERSLATRTTEDTETPLLVSPWLVEGLREASRWQNDASDRRLYETMFRSGGIFKLDGLFALDTASHRSLDATSRAAFTVSSGALVMALLEQPDGKQAFRSFLGDVALFAGEMPSLLRRHFPELNLSENSMEKWWRLLLAHKGTARLTDSLSIFETEAALHEGLRIFIRDENGGMREEPIESWPELLELTPMERAAATRMAADAIVRLSHRCFPSYRPLLGSYQEVLILIAQENIQTERIADRIGELAATRQNIISKAERARDFMDWFEITRARETSGAFDDYLRLKQQLRDTPGTTRSDPVTKTLDRFDSIFHRESNIRPHQHPGGW
ncbi:MAG: hypothetical protein ACNA8L_13100 [Luteolibacter sp.]|jgi:hypothetical protein